MITQQSIWSALKDLASNNVFDVVGSGAPTSGTSGTGVNICGPGSSYTDTATGNCYYNTGTLASPTWTSTGIVSGDVTVTAGVSAISSSLLKRTTGTISAAAIVGTSAGQLGHANGVVLQAAPGASAALQIIAFGLYYTFATAAYTAGGNLTVNWGSGGAALTGLVSAANSVGAASSKGVQFFPLATAGVAIVSNVSLNLVSSAAFTQPGTAAGTIAWELWYRQLTVGF
jgi:hypothetical protein